MQIKREVTTHQSDSAWNIIIRVAGVRSKRIGDVCSWKNLVANLGSHFWPIHLICTLTTTISRSAVTKHGPLLHHVSNVNFRRCWNEIEFTSPGVAIRLNSWFMNWAHLPLSLWNTLLFITYRRDVPFCNIRLSYVHFCRHIHWYYTLKCVLLPLVYKVYYLSIHYLNISSCRYARR